MAQNSLSDVIAAIKQQEVGMASKRDTCSDAFDYAMALAESEGMTKTIMLTAILVYHNTLLDVIVSILEEHNERTTAPSNTNNH